MKKKPYTRDSLWRGLMVCAMNECLRSGLVGLRPWENYWPGAPHTNDELHRGGATALVHVWESAGHVLRVRVRDIGFHELSLSVQLDPTAVGMAETYDYPLGRPAARRKRAALATGMGWVERKTGPFLMSSPGDGGRRLFFCPPAAHEALLAVAEKPAYAYKDRGKIFL